MHLSIGTSLRAARAGILAALVLGGAAAGPVCAQQQPPADAAPGPAPPAAAAPGSTAPSPGGGSDLAQVLELQRDVQRLRELHRTGKFADGVDLAASIVARARRLHGPEDQITRGSLYNQGVILSKVGRNDEAARVLAEALAIEGALGSPGGESYKRVALELVGVHKARGQWLEATKVFHAAIAALQAEGAAGEIELAYYTQELGAHLRGTSNFDLAEEMFRRALAIRERRLPPDDFRIGSTLNQLAGLLRTMGRYEEAGTAYQRALAIVIKAKGEADPNVGIILDNYAYVLNQAGRRGEAETIQKRALGILETALGLEHLSTAQAIANLAALYYDQRRYEEAEPLFQRAFNLFIKRLPRSDPRIGVLLDNMAGLYRERGQHDLARKAYQMALESMLASYPANHPEVGTVLNNLALSEAALGRHDGAIELLKRALAIAEEVLGREHQSVAVALANMADSQLAQGRRAEAEASYLRAVGILERSVGRDHPRLIWPLSGLGEIALAEGRAGEAVARLRRAVAIEVAETERDRTRHSGGTSAARRVRLHASLVDAAWAAGAADAAGRDALAAETFETTQRSTLSAAGSTLAQLGARLAAGDGALAKAVREHQDLAKEWAETDKRLSKAVSERAEKRDLAAEGRLKARMVEIDARIGEIDRHLADAYPAFATLASLRPATVAATREQLRPHEALLQYFVSPERVYAWLVTRDGVAWRRLDTSGRELVELVQALRCGLDPAEWVGEKRPVRCLTLLGRGPEGAELPFDLARARKGYDLLVRPFEAEIRNRHLLVVASGPLTSLPFQVLVAGAAGAAETAGLAGVPWLLRSNPTTVLPSAASLVSLRQGATRSAAARPYVGIGNPLLLGAGGDDRRAFEVSPCRPAARQLVAGIAQRLTGGASVSVLRGGAGDVERVRLLEPLPETAEELCAVAEALGAGADDVLAGAAATETSVRRRNADGGLAAYKVLHFATHGLVSGEIRGLGEPALVMSPPETPSETDDGLLTASEVAALKLDADWVILSACNTAAGDGLGAEALSGLARSFFYAGARSLLVSHWPVQSVAAVKLTTHAIRELAARPEIGRAEALRRAMAALLAGSVGGDALDAHPSVWAPFVVVGEGGGALAPVLDASAALGAGAAPANPPVPPQARPRPARSAGKAKRGDALPTPAWNPFASQR